MLNSYFMNLFPRFILFVSFLTILFERAPGQSKPSSTGNDKKWWKEAVVVNGKYTLLDKGNSKVYAHTRDGEGGKMLIALNFTRETVQAVVGQVSPKWQVVLSNYKNLPERRLGKTSISLRPYEAVIYRL
jgi:hypothetical protein